MWILNECAASQSRENGYYRPCNFAKQGDKNHETEFRPLDIRDRPLMIVGGGGAPAEIFRLKIVFPGICPVEKFFFFTGT